MSFQDAQGNFHQFHGRICVSVNDFREVGSGDVGNIVANGGILASDTTPALIGASTGISQEITWVTGNVDPIVCQFTLPQNFDGRDDVLIDLWVSSGTTDVATFSVATSWDAGATVTDSASDAGTLSATRHKITATVSAADIPDNASFVSVQLTPPTHATNAIQLSGMLIRVVEKTL